MISAALSLLIITAPQDTQSVRNAIEGMISGVKAKNYEQARTFVKVSSAKFQMKQGGILFANAMDAPGFVWEIVSVNQAKGSGVFTVTTKFGGKNDGQTTEDVMVATVNGNVKLLPKFMGGKSGPVGFWASILDNDPEDVLGKSFVLAKKAAQKTTALSNGKQVGLSFFMYMADHDDVFPGSNWKKAVEKYLKNKELFSFSYEGKTYSYAMNSNLYKFNATALAKPQETVMLYFGQQGKPNFIFNGQTIIVYADGHAKAINKEQAKKLIWKP